MIFANNFYSFSWDLISALFLGILLFCIGALIGWSLWKDRHERHRQAPRASESLRRDIERLEGDVKQLETT